jgi:hypothetical protein
MEGDNLEAIGEEYWLSWRSILCGRELYSLSTPTGVVISSAVLFGCYDIVTTGCSLQSNNDQSSPLLTPVSSWLTIDGVCIGNGNCWTLLTYNLWPYFTHQYHTRTGVLSHGLLCCAGQRLPTVNIPMHLTHVLADCRPFHTIILLFKLPCQDSLIMADGPRNGPHRKHSFQQSLCYCMLHSLVFATSQDPRFLLYSDMPQC